ncbi:thiolase-like protein [Xylaria castorea]|nr:thiolase-like protein [Xylaria castorea]
MALRLLCSLSTPQEFWQFLLNKGDALYRVPASRFDVNAYYALRRKPSHVGTEYGLFDNSIDKSALDTSIFSPSQEEAERLDPQQRLLLEVAQECFKDARITGDITAIAIVVRPLADANRDRNPVRAIIGATSYNANRDFGTGIPVLSTNAVEILIRHTYPIASITDLGVTAIVECHGTSTLVGDPLGCNAVTRVFRGSGTGVYVGSVNPNVGHTGGALGLVPFIKMVLAIKNQTIPPNVRFTSPKPKIPFKAAKLTVLVDPISSPTDKLEHMSINFLDVSGLNGYVSLDSAATTVVAPITHNQGNGPQLLLYPANTANSLGRFAT